MRNLVSNAGSKLFFWVSVSFTSLASAAFSTPYTMTVPATGVALPSGYPEAGGVAMVFTGVNGNIYYQFSNPAGAFRGFNSTGDPTAFQGNPFTINNPITLDCGFSSCTDYFGGSIASIDVRFSAFDGDTQVGGFDYQDITLQLNGFNMGSWSDINAQNTDDAGTTSFGFTNGFGNNVFTTSWFNSTNAAMLSDILTTGSVTTQVFDADPNDNYWDFRRGNNLANDGLTTVAPGYTLEKTAHSGSANGPEVTQYASVGDTIQVGDTVYFKYIVTNIGSVDINNLAVVDDKVATVTCDKTTINDVPFGSLTPDFATCTGTYVITQDDVDNGSVTNIASATGVPDFGQLGTLSDTVTLNGPAFNSAITLDKTASVGNFGVVGNVFSYNFTITNTGNTTLSNVSVSDPKIPGLVCTFAEIGPLSALNSDNTETCSGNYTVTQADVDAFAINATQLANTATVTSTDPGGNTISADASLTLPGLAAAPAMTVEKNATEADFDAVGDVINYTIKITNTGNVTFPAPPVVTDSLALTTGPTCPAGAIAPAASVTCTATYTVVQADLDARTVHNQADATITVGGVTANGSDTADVVAVINAGLEIVKQLAAASPTDFNATGVELTYDYILTNSGNVSLATPSVTDDKVTVVCPAGVIAPGDSITCTSTAGPYLTTQADLDAGGITNTASASATAVGGAEVVDTVDVTLTVPAIQEPAMTVVKTAPNVDPADFAPGLVVSYSYTVQNTGNVSLVDQITVTDDHIVGAFDCGAPAEYPLAVGDDVSCTANYTVTAQDVANGVVTNIASATDGTTTSPTDTATIPQAGTPALGLAKFAAEPNFDDLTDTLSYTFVVTNTGDTNIVDLSPITVNDPMVGAVDCSGQPAILAPTQSFNCTATYSSITQAQLDAGEVVNTATASFIYTDGGGSTTVTSSQATATVPSNAVPALTLVKEGPVEFGVVGSSITYTFNVTNNGTQTLISVDITDPLLGGAACTIATDIAPGATGSCTADYTITQADVDAENVHNEATATGHTQTGATATDTDDDDTPVDINVASKIMSFTKSADKAAFAAVGETIVYTFEVSNDGTQTLTNIVVNDPLFGGVVCNIASLAPGVTNNSCTANYTVTQDDVDAGARNNTATATADGGLSETASATVNGPVRSSTLDFTKAAAGGYSAAGDAVTFTMSVQNTGNVRLNNVVVTDAFFTPNLTCNIGTIDPGMTDSSCVGTYIITQADVDAGSITNTAHLNATGADGTDFNDLQASETVNGPAANPAITLIKAEDDGDGAFDAVPDTELFTFTVQNTGNVTLTNVILTDPKTSFTCHIADLAPGAFAPNCTDGGGTPLSTTANLVQSDMDAGGYENTASVSADTTQAPIVTVTDESTVELVSPVQTAAIAMVKTITSGAPFSAVGDDVVYSYVVTNNGNTTLAGSVEIVDDKISSVSCPALPAGGLAPAATLTCTGTYQITQADLDAGSVTNIAHAETSAFGAVILSADDQQTATAAQNPQLSIDKHVKSGTPSTYDAPNDTVTFEYVVTNTGNVTTTAPITIADDKIPGNLNCAPAGIAPGASVICEQTWTAVQADVTAGSVTNIATADTTFGGNPVQSAPDSVTINAIQTPGLDIVKSITSQPVNLILGGELAYQYDVTNVGNVTFTNNITVSDNMIAVICPALPVGGLLPGATLVCATDPLVPYVISNNDLRLGAVTNIASATTTFDGQSVTSPTDSAIFPVDGSPALSIVKTATVADGGATFDQLGDIIHYSFAVQNTGDPDLPEDIFINDPLLGGSQLCHTGVLSADASPVPSGNGETTVCDAQNPVANAAFDYAITQADLDRGFVLNEATATTIFAPGSPNPVNVVSPPDTETVNADTNPQLTVLKTSTTPLDPAAAVVGTVVNYIITTTNSGNQTISGITVSDPLIPTLNCNHVGDNIIFGPTNIDLIPGQAVECKGSYTVTQADIDGQSLTNTATAEGSDPQSGIVVDTGTDIQPLAAPDPELSIVKSFTSGTADYVGVGQTIDFTITVKNEGNVTLSSTTITDDLVAGSCVIGSLAPQESDNSCHFVYTITQSDIDNNAFTNTVTAVAQPVTSPPGTTISESGSATGNGPDREPASSLTKVADTASVGAAGDTINYTFRVANTGNVSLFGQPRVTDDKIGTFDCGTISATGLPPTAFVTCTAPYIVTQADVDAGTVVNNATVGNMQDIENNPVPVSAQVTETVDVIRTPGVSITKTASKTANVVVGDVITYTYDVTNTGNVTLTAVTLNDLHTSAAGTAALAIAGDVMLTDNGTLGDSTDAAANGVWDMLAPADVVRFTSSYTVTQADIDAGADITNTVSVTTRSPAGTTPPTTSVDETVGLITATPSLEVTKTMTAAPVTVGGVVEYSVTVQNTGNVTLGALTSTDNLLRNDNVAVTTTPVLVLASGDANADNLLDVTETWVYTASYVLEQADIDAGGIKNSVTVTATAPDGSNVSDVSDDGTGPGSKPTTLIIAADPGLEVLKTMSAAPTEVGETVNYTITVKNIGNVTLNSVAIASDTLTRADNTVLALAGSGVVFITADAGSAQGVLQVGETATYHASYVLTQQDVDAGGISNSATAVGTPPTGSPVSDVSDDGTGGPGGDNPTDLEIISAPAMELLKSASSPSFDTLDQVITFTFTVKNTGNVTLNDPFTVTDPMITNAGGAITCAAPPLAPNAELVCTGDYVVTQADLDAGVINNSATVSDGTTTSPPATESIVAIQAPAMEVLKEAGAIDPADFIVGAVVNYTYTVTNTGNVTITDPISISDNLIDAADITCPAMPATGLAPLGVYECTGTYEVTVNDVVLSSATNIASATDGTTTSPDTSETVPSNAVPALTIIKASTAGADFDAVGDIISYEYTVTNSGTASFATEVLIHDDKIATPIVCFDPAGPAGPDLIPGESVTCTADYTVIQDDLDAGFVTNQAFAQTIFGGTTDVVSPPQSVTVDSDAKPKLKVEKTAATLPVTAVGQVLTYTIKLENIGNQTLSNVSVSDPLIPALVCEVAELTVTAPGNEFECTGTYQVRQSDIDAGTLVNTATAHAVDPQGGDVTGTGVSTVDMPVAAPSLTFSKLASPSPFGAVGSVITYSFAVENTGNVTLLNAHVTDVLDPAYDCVIASIAPGFTDTSCTLSLVVTQDHVDAGEIVNAASVTATDPFNTPVTKAASITTAGPPRVPAMEVTKTAGGVAQTLGTLVPYSLSVENTGNVSITVTGITDTMTREDGSVIALDAPFALTSGDADSDGILDVGETWIYTASYTITQDDINAGGFHNTATVSGTGPGGTPVSDVSDNGNDGDGNTTDDPTLFEIIAAPSLEATKIVGTSGVMAGDLVSFTIEILNNGNLPLENVAVADTLTRVDGTPLTVGAGQPVFTGANLGSAAGILLVGETATYTLTYQLTQDDIDAGGISNTVVATGTDLNGDPVIDVSDDGDDTDGNTTDDPTVMSITPNPGLEVVKTLLTTNMDSIVPGDEVRFSIAAENTGNVTLTAVTMIDTLTDLDGGVLTPASVVYAGDGTLDVGETETWDVRYVITQDDIDSGGIQNSAQVTGTAPNGGSTTDVSDDGDDTDGNLLDDPTIAAITPVETVSAIKSVNTPTRIEADIFMVTFVIEVTNTGNVSQKEMQVEDDLTVFVAPATLPIATHPPVVRVSGFTTATANAAYDGATDINLLSGTPELAPGETGTIEIDVFYDISTGSPDNPNTAVISSARLSANVTAVVIAPVAGAAPDILAVKTVTPANVKRGDSVTYTIKFVNGLATAEAGLTLVDQMPAGLTYTVGTATFNGAAVPAPVQIGRRLTWPGVRLEPSDGVDGGPDEVIITLKARVTGGGGKLTNEAYVLNSAGDRVSNTATATLKIAPEHVFDCSDIIGKVFDDKDMDGYQDQGEPGLAGVRLVTVNGELITTDAYGRYHVPCASLPDKIGSNFILKLDTRTLPSGYRVTTENPRVIWVTAGKFARLNFGAALSNVVDIDLTETAFDPLDGKPSPALKEGIKNLVKQLRATPSVVRLSYYRIDEDEKLAEQRLKTVEKLLRQAWRGQGRYRLLIERTIKRMQ